LRVFLPTNWVLRPQEMPSSYQICIFLLEEQKQHCWTVHLSMYQLMWKNMSWLRETHTHTLRERRTHTHIQKDRHTHELGTLNQRAYVADTVHFAYRSRGIVIDQSASNWWTAISLLLHASFIDPISLFPFLAQHFVLACSSCSSSFASCRFRFLPISSHPASSYRSPLVKFRNLSSSSHAWERIQL
jgi:hypothetical protein